MHHYFDVDIATKYGINAAIILQNLGHWIKRNEANESNYYDGYYWTFNSRKAYQELFPYMSKWQIENAFKKLIDEGLVITGNYNEMKYDRTMWYALTEKAKCILHFREMDCSKIQNGSCKNGKPIPNINTDINANINTDKEERKQASKTNSTTFNEIIESYTQNQDLQISLKEFIKMRALIKKKLTDHALKLLLNKLDRLATSDTEKIDIVNQSITNSWAGFFEVRQQTKQEPQRPIIQETEDQRRERELNEAIKAKFYGKR